MSCLKQKVDVLTKKCEVHPTAFYSGTEVKYRYSSTLSLTSALDKGGLLTPRPGRFTGNLPIPIVYEAGFVLTKSLYYEY
jgi:hypothetical protein